MSRYHDFENLFFSEDVVCLWEFISLWWNFTCESLFLSKDVFCEDDFYLYYAAAYASDVFGEVPCFIMDYFFWRLSFEEMLKMFYFLSIWVLS